MGEERRDGGVDCERGVEFGIVVDVFVLVARI